MCRNGNILLRLEAEGVAIALRGVLYSVNGECLRILAEICVQDALETLLPSRGESLVRVLCHCLHISLEHSVELGLSRLRCSVIHSGHLYLRDNAVVCNHMKHVVSLASRSESEVSVKPYILFSTVGIRVADHEKLGEIRIFRFVCNPVDTDDLGLYKSNG